MLLNSDFSQLFNSKISVVPSADSRTVRFSDVPSYQPVLTYPSIDPYKSPLAKIMNPDQEATFEGGTAVSPTSTVEISISCRDLADKDILSKSDPLCVVFHKPRRTKKWVEFMRTEIVDNNLNPDFVRKATMEYHFEMQQNLRFEVYDIDTPNAKLDDHDSIGFLECTLAQIVSAGQSGFTASLTEISHEDEDVDESPSKTEKKSPGTIILIAEELSSLKDEVHMTLGATSIGKRLLGCIPPVTFYTISKILDTGKYIVVYRSEKKRGRNPTWGPIIISLSRLCNGDKDRRLKIECFQVGLNGSEKSVAFTVTTVSTLSVMGAGGLRMQAPDGRDLNSTLMIAAFKIAKIFTFIDYIQSGTQIHCCFSIDFTSSNGDPSEASSLHYFSPQANRPNVYEQAIMAVGQIIQDYDDDKLFPVYGFGARIPPIGEVSHNFFITLKDSPYCQGIKGVLDTYKACIRQIQLYGPTNFAPVIRHVAEMASKSENGSDYYVLIIITDGVITDMPQTREAIVNASSLPFSIIIIGVGGADFEAMEELDGDDVRISYNGRNAERDIVQFVPYRDAQSWVANSNGGPGTGSWVTGDATDFTNKFAQSQLAAEVLAEIPDQLTGYMKSKGIFPKLPAEKPATPMPPVQDHATVAKSTSNPTPPRPAENPLPPPQINPINQDIPQQTHVKSPPKPAQPANGIQQDHPPVIMQKSSPPSGPTVVKAQETSPPAVPQPQQQQQPRIATPPKLQPEQASPPKNIET